MMKKGDSLLKTARFVEHIRHMGWSENTVNLWLREPEIFITEDPEINADRIHIGAPGFGWRAPIELVREMWLV